MKATGAATSNSASTLLILRLSDGRRIAMEEHGRPGGATVIVCHGLPGSRRLAPGDPMRSPGHGLRVLVPDRPGIGATDPAPGRSLSAWADDLQAICERLRLERVALCAFSAGAPFALAAAAALPDRVAGVALVGGLGEIGGRGGLRSMDAPRRLGWAVVRWLPLQARLIAQAQARQVRRGGGAFAAALGRRMADGDRAAMREPSAQRALAVEAAEAFRQGSAAVAREMRLVARPWDFDPRTIAAPVTMWHGIDDRAAPLALISELADKLPKAELHRWQGGHMPDVAWWDDIAECLAGWLKADSETVPSAAVGD